MISDHFKPVEPIKDTRGGAARMSTTPVHQVQVLGHVQRFLTSFVVKDNEPRVCQEHSVGLAVPLRPRFDSPSSSPMLLRTAAEMSRLGHEKRGEAAARVEADHEQHALQEVHERSRCQGIGAGSEREKHDIA